MRLAGNQSWPSERNPPCRKLGWICAKGVNLKREAENTQRPADTLSAPRAANAPCRRVAPARMRAGHAHAPRPSARARTLTCSFLGAGPSGTTSADRRRSWSSYRRPPRQREHGKLPHVARQVWGKPSWSGYLETRRAARPFMSHNGPHEALAEKRIGSNAYARYCHVRPRPNMDRSSFNHPQKRRAPRAV